MLYCNPLILCCFMSHSKSKIQFLAEHGSKRKGKSLVDYQHQEKRYVEYKWMYIAGCCIQMIVD